MTTREKLAAIEAAIDNAEMFGDPTPLYVQRRILEAEIELEESVAFELWKHEADRAAPSVGRNRTMKGFAEEAPQTRDRWLGLARAAIAAIEPVDIPEVTEEQFKEARLVAPTERKVVNTGFGLVLAECDCQQPSACTALGACAIDLRAKLDDQLFESFTQMIGVAIAEAGRAITKFPQPNYVISKVAEEAGEVVKAAIHCAEGREKMESIRGEMTQLVAMLYRLWVEGDQVHGLPPVGTTTQTCAKCGGKMEAGHALEQTFTAGAPDFPGADRVTMSAGGPGRMVACRKCKDCGWSVTA